MEGDLIEAELQASLILSRLPDFGTGGYWQLRKHLGSSRAILETPADTLVPVLSDAARDELRAWQSNPDNHPLSRQVERDLEWLADHRVTLLAPEHSDYPALLKEVHKAPPLLYVRGDVDNLALPQLAIVGSRNPSSTGRDNAFNFARQLSQTGFVITSGLALGVDGAAHRGALAAEGKTIGVTGTGIDKIYPQRHRTLFSELLAQGGTIVSEFPLGSSPHPANFPRRNRIISGLSLGVLVVEAALKSGSLITARYAMQQGREVFAIPGSIHNPMSRGCHALLREGATLVEGIEDLRDPLQGLLAFKWSEAQPAPSRAPSVELNREEQLVFDSMGFEAASLDTLMERTGLEAGPVLATLMSLELKGLVAQTAGGYERKQP